MHRSFGFKSWWDFAGWGVQLWIRSSAKILPTLSAVNFLCNYHNIGRPWQCITHVMFTIFWYHLHDKPSSCCVIGEIIFSLELRMEEERGKFVKILPWQVGTIPFLGGYWDVLKTMLKNLNFLCWPWGSKNIWCANLICILVMLLQNL